MVIANSYSITALLVLMVALKVSPQGQVSIEVLSPQVFCEVAEGQSSGSSRKFSVFSLQVANPYSELVIKYTS